MSNICFLNEGLDPAFQGYYRVATKDQTIGKNELKKGDRVFADIGSANLNVCDQESLNLLMHQA